ncbi:MAG TPA: rhodanese-like domain-containing protein [Anaeromyxobacteraceae bacterium]|nr:rhodanese-like domain-containing protein [Anaeromyxobacteraceae bacterium]
MTVVRTALALWATLTAAASQAGELVSADEAKALLGKPEVRFFFAGNDRDFEKGHIPGSATAYSHDLHLLDDVRACKGLPMCEPRAAKVIGELGIDSATKVVVYDVGHGVDASGGWFFLTLYGVKDVRILDGGLATWKARGGAVEAGPPARPAPKAFTPAVQWGMIASVDEVKKATGDAGHYLLLDARHTLDEYTGKTLQSALAAPGKEETVKRGGAIPGAVFSPFTKYAGNKGAEPDKPMFKEEAELRKQLQKLDKNGYARGKTVISYCHVGLGRGSFQYLALRRAGHQNVKVYVGSWDEWGNDPSLPLAAQP